MRRSDFFDETLDPPNFDVDPWGMTTYTKVFKQSLVENARRGPVEGRTDVELALGLCDLAHEELRRFATDGDQVLQNDDMRSVLNSLRAVLRRLSVSFDLPYRDFESFRSHWIAKGVVGSGSWAGRRELLEGVFGPLDLELMRLEEKELEGLARPISPRATVGWPDVDQEIRELRRRFSVATSPQDYRAIGVHCVGVMEALGAVVYDESKHLPEGEKPPRRDKPKVRIGVFIEERLEGSGNAVLRGVVNKTVELAHEVKHAVTPTRTSAGIASDAVILLANMLRRLHEA